MEGVIGVWLSVVECGWSVVECGWGVTEGVVK